MTVGKGGNYDENAERLLLELDAQGVVLLVVGGSRGSGFSVALEPQVLEHMPEMLEQVAKQMRADIVLLKGEN